MAEKFLDDSERLYGEPHPTRYCVRNSRRIVVKVSHCSSQRSSSQHPSCSRQAPLHAAFLPESQVSFHPSTITLCKYCLASTEKQHQLHRGWKGGGWHFYEICLYRLAQQL